MQATAGHAPQGFDMRQDDELPVGSGKQTVAPDAAPVLPAQLGQKLRNLFADVESQPAPDRLRELLEALAAKEKNPD